MRQLVDTADEIQNESAHLKSVIETIDTTTAGGRVLFHVLGAIADFERESVRERVAAGMMAAKRNGCALRLGTAKAEMARSLLDGDKCWAEVSHLFSVSPSTLSRALRRYPVAVA